MLPPTAGRVSFSALIGWDCLFTVTVAVGGVSVPPVGLPPAVAILVTEPASRSVWVMVYVAVQVVASVGASVLFGQLTVAILSSLTVIPLMVTLPVLVTT